MDAAYKAYENESNPDRKQRFLDIAQHHNLRHDYFRGSVKQINHLIQFDAHPNSLITEPQCEIYKITISILNVLKGYLSKFSCLNGRQLST